MRTFAVGAVLFVATASTLGSTPAWADRFALRNMVHNECLPRARDHQDPPLPCDAVDLSGGEDRGVAFMKDRVGVAQMLAISTGDVSGIEDSSLLQPDAPNYFAIAWQDGRPLLGRHFQAPLARGDVGLAINAQARRSQDQFHIHIDCLKPEVAAAVAEQAQGLGETWRPMVTLSDGRTYQARTIVGEALGENPFVLLADGVPNARAHMGDWSLAVVGAQIAGRPGFVLLADKADWLGGGHAESLLDHACAIKKPR